MEKVFHIRAVDRTGNVVELDLNGSSKAEISADLEKKGLHLLELKEKKSVFSRSVSSRFSEYELIFFFRQLSAMLSAGISIGEAVSILAEKLTDPKLKMVFCTLQILLSEGKSFSRALTESGFSFHPLIISFVRQGEHSGDMVTVFRRLISYWERRRNTWQKMIDALIYPFVLMGIVVIIVCFLMVVVVPTFRNIYGDFGANLPETTKFVLFISDLIRGNIYLAVFTISAAAFAGFQLLKHKIELILGVFSGLPLISGIYSSYRLSYFCLALGSLIKSGMSVDESLHVLEDGFQGERIRKVREVLRGGISLSESIVHLRLFNEVNLQMVTVGENTGKLAEVFLNLGEFYESELEYSLRRIMAAFEPILILFMGVIVGFIVMSMFLPIIQMAVMIK